MRMLLLMVVVMNSLFWSGCGEKPSSAPGRDPAAVAKDEATQEKKSTASGERPAVAESSNSGVELSSAAQRRIGLALAPAQQAPLADVLTLTGSVQPIDSRIAHVRPLARGQITEVLVKLGDRVRAGQVLARLDNIEAGELSSQYNTAQAELSRLHIQQSATARQADRIRNLAAIGAVSQKELEAIEAELHGQDEAIRAQESTLAGLTVRLRRFGITEPTAATPTTTSIQAPFAGVVTVAQAASGEVVDTTTELFSVADLSRVYVVGQVYERDLGRVQVGQPTIVIFATFPDMRFPGHVASISQLLDPQTRTAAVRVELPNVGERLRLDMFASVELPTVTKHTAIAVPSEAVQQMEGHPVVFVRQDPTHFIARPVQLGAIVGSMTEVTRGLVAGELVVTNGAFQVKSAMLSNELGQEGEK